MNALEKLRSVVDELKPGPDGTPAVQPLKIQPTWDLALRIAGRFPVDADRLAAAHRAKDAAELDAIVTELEGGLSPKPAGDGGGGGSVSGSPADHGIDKATLDAAMRSFKKRLKLARLNDESKLGGRYTSGGKQSKIDAIEPPREFPPEVWKALASEGRLVDTGKGFYSESLS